MEIEVVKEDKQSIELKVNNLTIAEILRVYLADQGIAFVAWKREHPSKPIIMKIDVSSGTVQKAVADAVAALKKDCDKLLSAIKK
ncbi:MAG TPA: RpoL/Rpb11 RNA polymerase subunit family protein [Candidatus Nanoarchaeia archaeon]|nr:RpoL/Rpb11 RNA polymerase subunit family protein [Candidatus Nanoarchaeia archaeon]